MPARLSIDELSMALDRVIASHRAGDGFVPRDLEMAVVHECRLAWLTRLRDALDASGFTPGPALVCEVPKANFGIRPGTLLSLPDLVVYTACVGRMAPLIVKALEWASPQKDYSYQAADLSSTAWLRNPFSCWKAFQETSLRRLDDGALLMLSSDVTGYFEHVSHELLMSDLRSAGATADVIDLLGACLSRWAIINGRGLPQGLQASHWLGKLYLNVVDRSLHDSGFKHVRYVDDIRVFCGTRAEAKRALSHLSSAMRRRGLNLQSAKTEILASREARAHVDGVTPTLTPLAKHYVAEIAEQLKLGPDYITVAQAEEALREDGALPPTGLLQDAYRFHFMEPSTFEKTLFRFLLNRLGRAKDDFAADHAMTQLDSHPEETDTILHYYSSVRSPDTAEEALLRYLRSDEAVYPFQIFQIVRWRARYLVQPGQAFLSYVRELYRSSQPQSFVHAAAQLFLAHFGSASDLIDIGASYANASDETSRAECLLCMYRIEKGQRNALLGKAKNDGLLPSTAIALVRAERCPTIMGVT